MIPSSIRRRYLHFDVLPFVFLHRKHRCASDERVHSPFRFEQTFGYCLGKVSNEFRQGESRCFGEVDRRYVSTTEASSDFKRVLALWRELLELNREELDDVGRDSLGSDHVQVEFPLTCLKVEGKETFGVEGFEKLELIEFVRTARRFFTVRESKSAPEKRRVDFP